MDTITALDNYLDWLTDRADAGDLVVPQSAVEDLGCACEYGYTGWLQMDAIFTTLPKEVSEIVGDSIIDSE